MEQKRESLINALALALILLATLLIVLAALAPQRVKDSPMCAAVGEFRSSGEWAAPAGEKYAPGSCEGLFLQGMEHYVAREYDAARDRFSRALEAEISDPGLYAYLYYFINQCAYLSEGVGEADTVAMAMGAAAQYPPLANDGQLLWDMVSTISMTTGSDAEAIALMQDYLEFTEGLGLEAWAWLKNCIAMLQYNNREYAGSIRNFYDVELTLQNAELTPELQVELRYAREYIANIHFIFEDYEGAAARYGQLIEDTAQDESFHSYGCYINLASAYLELGDTASARGAMRELGQNLHLVDAGALGEVDATMQDMLANIYIMEGDLAAANAHLSKAEEYYAQSAGDAAFLGGENYILLTRCKYLVTAGALAEAERRLEGLLSGGEAAYYGLEQDVYELLGDIYLATGEHEKLAGTYARLLELDEEFAGTMQREYLEFSAYYREANQLAEHNQRLSRVNTAAIVAAALILAVLVAVLVLVKMLRAKNVADQLTGVFNRKKLSQLSRTYRRSGTPGGLGVVMMDIDYFKRYNDSCGHPAGDEVLKKVANVIAGCTRGRDMVIRYGGEEFLALLSGVQAQTAAEVCGRIRQQLEKAAIPHPASDAAAHVTLSMGLCHQQSAGKATLEELIRNADSCLYRSKEGGRNRLTTMELG